MSRYDVRSIASSNLPVGGATSKPKTLEPMSETKMVKGLPAEDRNKELSSATSLPFPSQNSTATINFGVPIKQDHSSSLWAALGYQNSAIATNNGTTPLSNNGTTPFGMENEGFYNGCGYNYQQHGGSSSGTAACMVSNDGTTHEAVGMSSNGNWIQPAKTNLSSFQTPIFGIE